MSKRNKKSRKASYWELYFIAILVSILIWASVGPSNASESHEIITEGYEGSERVIIVEKPVKGKSNTSRKTGWVGNKRIDLRTTRTNEYTRTVGWKGDTYINVKERKDD